MSGVAIVISQMRGGQMGGCCRARHIFPPVSSLSRFCASSSSLPICAAEHQRLGSNPRGSPNPGDYPASFPPLPSTRHCFAFRSSICDRGGGGDKWDEWMPWTRQCYPQVHWVIPSSFAVFFFFFLNAVNTYKV